MKYRQDTCPKCGQPKDARAKLCQPCRIAQWQGKAEDWHARFWAKVDKRGPDECWNWLAGHTVTGYAEFSRNNQMLRANRVSYELHHGRIPPGLDVCHTCDNPACCNPAHLFLGTSHDNAQDCIVKGRAKRGDRRGERSGRAVVTADQVPLIRNEALAGLSHRTLARKYGLSKTQIGRIVRGESWQHIT